MKNLLVAVLMLFATSLVFGSQPDYDVGQKEVKVFVKSLNGNVSYEAATVDLNTLEVKSPKESFAIVTAFEIKGNMVGIKTVYNYCEHLYIAEKPDKSINTVLAVPWQSYERTNQINYTTLYNHSSGGLPRMYI
ncbi:hypothetical protein P2559Y_0033 [Croceibacter phage P2559Y]|uniref:hypothetical protein n=1 Tax=Croceibacter phage P2559Y TaxID=1327037 RepID=UPI0003F4AB2E|nr:hypothetical protein P2559Y_0033 [Croceibacter phage P2559Y]AGM14096.1 hypothetical protein P2559Y_0033 [Croceibacter phage P2559Y]